MIANKRFRQQHGGSCVENFQIFILWFQQFDYSDRLSDFGIVFIR